MGLFAIFLSSPTPWQACRGDVAYDGLASGVDVNMLDSGPRLPASSGKPAVSGNEAG